MKKTLNINLAGRVFHIDEDAFDRLESYLSALKQQFSRTEGGNEIIADIENRMAELFAERLEDTRQVIENADVGAVISILGNPSDFAEAGADEVPPAAEAYHSTGKRIYRDPDNRVLGGVAAGLAAYFNIDPLWIRILFLILLFTGPGFLIYIIMWIIIPRAQTTAEKLRMRGEPVNVSTIQRSIRDEMKSVEESAHKYTGKSSHRAGDFFRDLGKFILDALRLIFRFVFKLLGLAFLILGFTLLISLIAALFTKSIHISGVHYGLNDALEFLHLLTVDGSHHSLIQAGFLLCIAGPVLLIIYLGIRILFNLDPLTGTSRSALGLLTLTGFILLAVGAAKLGLEFSEEGEYTRQVELPQHEHYLLRASDDSLSQHFLEHYKQHWKPGEGWQAFNLVEMNVHQSTTGQAYLEIFSESQGNGRKEARKNAERIRYVPETRDSVIELPLYYLLTDEERFRAQRIDVRLYLPEGSRVNLDPSLADYLYDVDNLQNMWDYEMAGRTWIMTASGLSCQGCEIPDAGLAPETENDSIARTDSLRTKI